MQLRVRSPAGQYTIAVDDGKSVAEFRAVLSEKSSIPVEALEALTGYPPRMITWPADPQGTPISSLGLAAGDTVTVRPAVAAPSAATVSQQRTPEPTTQAAATGAGQPDAHLELNGMSEDEALARAIALSMVDVEDPQPNQAAGNPPAASRPPQTMPGRPAAPHARLADGGAVVQRVIDSDNSCLFNAVGYVMERSRFRSSHLRQVIARTVLADEEQWCEAVLGKEPAAYCEWIQRKNSWGGAIEISILSKHYQREIAAFDIQTQRVDVYGSGENYSERVMLLYDGLHYDALAVAADASSPESADTTILQSKGARTDAVMDGAAKLVKSLHDARQFTDVAKFTLRCGVCRIGVTGEKEAVQHAKQTGHTDFSEYH